MIISKTHVQSVFGGVSAAAIVALSLISPVQAQESCPFQPVHSGAEGRVRTGMSQQQVRAQLGAPNCVRGGGYNYTIGNGRILIIYFENGRVSSTRIISPAG